MDIRTPRRSDPPAEPTAPVARQPACLRSEALFVQRREIQIEHAGERYRLRITRNNRLILTK